MKKVAVIGLDGMAWHILDKLFNWGAMPNLHDLTHHSVKGPMKSTIPPSSPPAWTSIASGVNPGKHGIFGFTRPNPDYSETRIVNSRDVKYLRIHEMVAAQNLTSVCVNHLLTYPIKRFYGSFVITDWLSPERQFSPEIGQYAEKYQGPTLFKVTASMENWDAYKEEVANRVETVNTLLQEVDWDLFWVVYSEPDHLFHRQYDQVMKRNVKILDMFQKLDETIGLAKDLADLVLVVSDHGFERFHHGIYVNALLEKQSLVKKKESKTMKDLVDHRNVSETRIGLRLPQRAYTYLAALPVTVEAVLLKIYKQLLKTNIKMELTSHVDPRSSRAFAHGFGIYVKEENLVPQILQLLQNKPYIGGVWKREELYTGIQLEAMPNLIVIPNFEEGYALRGDAITPKPVVRRDVHSHHPEGIVIAHKDNTQPLWTKDITVYDIAPTILDFLELEIPEDADGSPIKI